MSAIVTEGNGWVERIADRAELSVNFAGTGRNRAEAVRSLGQQVAAVEPVFGMAGTQVRSRRLSVSNDWRKDRRVGCRAVEQITLRLLSVELLEDVLNRLIAAEPDSLHGPYWLLDDPAGALREAQRAALDDARRRAEGYAEALGGPLGRLLRLSEVADGFGAPPVFRAAMASSEPAVDVRSLGLEPEPVRVSARCTTSWLVSI